MVPIGWIVRNAAHGLDYAAEHLNCMTEKATVTFGFPVRVAVASRFQWSIGQWRESALIAGGWFLSRRSCDPTLIRMRK